MEWCGTSQAVIRNMSAPKPKSHPIRCALHALLVSLVAVALSLGGGTCLAQDERPVELHPGFVAESPHANPTPELPAIDLVEPGKECEEDSAHKEARRSPGPDSFEIRVACSVIRITDWQQPDVCLTRYSTRSLYARGPPTLA